MRWEDERYVRFYTRDTPEFMAMSWQARGLLGLVMRKLDRAGILSVGKLGLRGVAVAVGGPWVEIEAPLMELLEDGCLVFDASRNVVVSPNFLEAQEAKQSDAARKRASRERARDSVSDPDPEGFIYIVRSCGTGRVKIGFSTSWQSRIRGMATDHGAKLEVLLVISGRPSDERALHKRFAAHLAQGEWFEPNSDLDDMVSRRRDADVRRQDHASHSVTPSHTESRSVTPCCAEPSVPPRADLEISSETVESIPDTYMPPAATSAHTAREAGHRGAVVDAAWLRDRLTAEVFRPILDGDDHLNDLAGRILDTGSKPEEVETVIVDYLAKRPGGALDAPEILRGLFGFLAGARRHRRAAERPLAPDERKAMDMWLRLWSREHKGAGYPVAERDHDHIRKLYGRAKTRARDLGLPQASDVVEHYIAGYLRIDDKKLVAERYPLAMLEARLPAIGEFNPKKQKPTVTPAVPEPPPPMAEIPTTFFQDLKSAARSGPIARRVPQ